MERVHLSVNGMENSQSKTSLKNALEKLDGVQMINVDLGRGSVEIGFNNPTAEADIKSCIENTGYTIG